MKHFYKVPLKSIRGAPNLSQWQNCHNPCYQHRREKWGAQSKECN